MFPLWLLVHVSGSLFDISSSKSQYPIFRYWRKSLDKNNIRFPPSNIGLAGCLLYISLLWMQGRRSAMTVMFGQVDPSLPTTTYGALYVVCRVCGIFIWSGLLFVYGWPLCVWTKVIQFSRENTHSCRNEPLNVPEFSTLGMMIIGNRVET